jgi:hypothetical protein
MFRFGRNGFLGAMLAALAVDSTAKRQRLDTELAEQRQQIREERKQAEARKREAEQRIRAARAERRRLLAQRVYDALQHQLTHARVGQFQLAALVGVDAINRFSAQIASLVAREIGKED